MNTEHIKRLRYRTSTFLRKVAKRIAPDNNPSIAFPNLGANQLPKNAPRALAGIGPNCSVLPGSRNERGSSHQ